LAVIPQRRTLRTEGRPARDPGEKSSLTMSTCLVIPRNHRPDKAG
jgi:hypothetical protein